MNPFSFYPIVLAAVVAVAAFSAYWLYRRRKTPEERERERRLWLANNGRIIDGTIIDVCEMPGEESHKYRKFTKPAQMLIFHYDVAGVTYEASQDVTHLQEYVDPKNCRIGVPASVRYDPQNPGNSIVVAETWTGLRKHPPIRLGIMEDNSTLEHKEQ